MAQYTEYHPLKFWLDPASIAEIVAHIQTYLVNNPINSTTEIETIIHDYLIAHPELIGGVDSVNGQTGEVVLTADNISAGENVTIKDVLDSLQDQIDDIVASIPSDYQQLIDDVSDLKSAVKDSSFADTGYVLLASNLTNNSEITETGGTRTRNGAARTNYINGSVIARAFSVNAPGFCFCIAYYSGISQGSFLSYDGSFYPCDGSLHYVGEDKRFRLCFYHDPADTVEFTSAELETIAAGVKMYNYAVTPDEIDGINQRIDETRVLLADKANRKNTDISGARRSYHRVYTKVDFSGIEFLNGIDMRVFSDGYSTIHDMDLALYKNTSQNTHNVSDQSALESALQNAVSGDTIILSSGVYTPITLNKSINLIGQGRVVFANQTLAPFATTSTAGVFKTTQTFDAEPPMILDLSRIDDGIILPLTKAGTLNECVATPGSWVLYKSIIYIHPSDGVMPAATDLVIVSKTGAIPIIKCYDFSENATVYLENIIAVGGRNCLLCSDYGSYNSQKVIAKNCKFYYSQTTNSVSLFGVVGFFQNCESAYSVKDGFNYHINTSAQWPGGPNTGTLSHGLEIDCIGHDNGLGKTAASPSDNGSTIHDGGTIVRIGGVYYGNCGGNVADKGPDTISYNYDCLAFDSTAPKDTNSADFWASTSTQMYLYGCRAKGSSQYSLFADDSAQIHANLCDYDTSTGDIID